MLLAVIGILIAACSGADGYGARSNAASRDAGDASSGGQAGIVEVTSTGMNFELPREIPSGWTTFRFNNRTDVTHFFILERLPSVDGVQKTVDDMRSGVVPVFQDAMNLITAGDPAAGFAEFERLPPWFGDIAFLGGTGMTAPGQTSQTTLHVEPGTYAIECYVKTPDGIFHSFMGMVAGLTVTEARSSVAEPEATLRVTIANSGIEIEGTPQPGMQTIAIRFAEQMSHEHLLGHDVHLARLGDGTDLNALAAWMDWTSPQGLATPAPAEFLGGAQELPAEQTAYLTVLLEPGRYALVAEVPNPAGKNMLKTFTVPGTVGN